MVVETRPNNSFFPDFSQVLRKETEMQNIGIALLIVANDQQGMNGASPLIWTIREKRPKEQTERSIGQISIPAETRKVDETAADNVKGALAEFCDDNLLVQSPGISVVRDSLYKDTLILNGHYVADLLVVVYDGPLNIPINPTNTDEVEPNGWMHFEDIMSSENVRPFLKGFIEKGQARSVAEQALDVYKARPDMRLDLFPPNFSIEAFYQRREQAKDISMLI